MGGRGASSVSEHVAGFAKPVKADNLTLAGQAVMESFARAATHVTDHFPGLKGNPYVNLDAIQQADIKTPGVLAYYGVGSKNIVVGNRTLDYQDQSAFHPSGTGNLYGVVAHELGHALSFHQLPGFRSVDDALRIAHARHNRGSPEKLTRGEFMRSISMYATENAHEAFAEAFADWTVNGINASKASLAIMRSWSERPQ